MDKSQLTTKYTNHETACRESDAVHGEPVKQVLIDSTQTYSNLQVQRSDQNVFVVVYFSCKIVPKKLLVLVNIFCI